MAKRSYVPSVLAGFIGGIAFLISCDSSGINTNPASATVTANQMFCYSISGLLFDISGANPPSPKVDSLNCYDTSGTALLTDLGNVYSKGWRIVELQDFGGIQAFVFEK